MVTTEVPDAHSAHHFRVCRQSDNAALQGIEIVPKAGFVHGLGVSSMEGHHRDKDIDVGTPGGEEQPA